MQGERIMSTKGKLKELLQYYLTTRQVGHTTTMLNGIKDDKVLIMSLTSKDAKVICQRNDKALPISYDAFDYTFSLRGRRMPLLIDNSAMIVLLEDALREISRLEGRIEYLKSMRKGGEVNADS
jgi:hypothetical protein